MNFIFVIIVVMIIGGIAIENNSNKDYKIVIKKQNGVFYKTNEVIYKTNE